QRRTGGLAPAGPAGEVYVGIHRKAYARQYMALIEQFLPAQAHRLTQLQPGFNAPIALGGAIMVDDPLYPLAPRRRVITVGEDGGILERDIHLVIEAVGNPAPDLPGGGAPLVHGNMERRVDVGAPTLVTEGLLECRRAHRLS